MTALRDDPTVGATGPEGTKERLLHLVDLEYAARHAGSARAVEKHRAHGKLTARERVELLVDPGSFVELDQLARHRATEPELAINRPLGDGVVTGTATVHGRPICLFSQDFTVYGGSLGEVNGSKIVKIMDLAARIGCPIVGINDSGGARIHEGVSSLALYAEIGKRNARLSGVVPQISMILGPCAGGAVYSPAMTDFTVMVERTSYMFVTGPDVVAAVTGEQTSFDELGGPDLQGAVAGNAHYVASDEADAFDWVRVLLGHLPQSNRGESEVYDAPDLALTPRDLALDRFMPDSANVGYDMLDLVETIVDDGDVLEISPRFGASVICAFCRIDGRSVGVVANQPLRNAGVLDIDASEKAARFVRFCDAFGLPIVTLVDVPGYMPGVEQERGGIIRRGAKLLYAYSEATVPMVTLIVGKAYGGGYATMGSKHLGADVNLAWPTARIAVMGGAGAVSVLHRRTLEQAAAEGRHDEVRDALIAQYETTTATPYLAAERGYLDAVIVPSSTRAQLVNALRLLRTKSVPRPDRKHGNIPL